MEYREAVQEARRLVKRSEDDQWRLAQLTWEETQLVTQRQWAEDIGISRSYVSSLARIWEQFGQHDDRPPFGETIRAIHQPGQMEEASRLGSQHAAEAVRHVRNMPVEKKAEVARELLADEKVADSVMRDTHTRARVSYARERVAEEIEDAARQREQASPVQRELARAGAYFEIGNHQRLARFHAAEAARQLQDLDQRDEGWMRTFRGNNQEIRDAVDWFDVILEGGRVDDASLAKFLEGGAS